MSETLFGYVLAWSEILQALYKLLALTTFNGNPDRLSIIYSAKGGGSCNKGQKLYLFGLPSLHSASSVVTLTG